MCKRGQAACEEHRNVVRMCKDVTRTGEVHLICQEESRTIRMRISGKANATRVLKKSMEEDTEKYRPTNLTFIPGKVMGHIILDVTSKCAE